MFTRQKNLEQKKREMIHSLSLGLLVFISLCGKEFLRNFNHCLKCSQNIAELYCFWHVGHNVQIWSKSKITFLELFECKVK